MLWTALKKSQYTLPLSLSQGERNKANKICPLFTNIPPIANGNSPWDSV